MLFVNSVQVESPCLKQEVFDSRKNKQSMHKIHRLDDVAAFIKFGKRVFVSVITKKAHYSGEVNDYNEHFLILNNHKISLMEILELKINLVK